MYSPFSATVSRDDCRLPDLGRLSDHASHSSHTVFLRNIAVWALFLVLEPHWDYNINPLLTFSFVLSLALSFSLSLAHATSFCSSVKTHT
jgi:hypothetical protein